MSAFDGITLAVILITTVIGVLAGFGNGLKFFSHGWMGRIVSVIICYFIFGLVLKIPFVEEAMSKFVAKLDENKWYLKILKYVRIDLIAFAVILYFVVQIAKRLLLGVIEKIFETNVWLMRILNKFLGAAIYLFILLLVTLIVFQIAYYIKGTDGVIYAKIQGSLFGLDKLYSDNPLNAVIDSIRQAFIK